MSVSPAFIVAPVLGSYFITYAIGARKYDFYRQAWFQPPGWVFGVVWTLLYVMLGAILWKSFDVSDWETFGLTWGLVGMTYLWPYIFNVRRDFKMSIYLVVAILTLALILYVQLYYSKLVDEDSFGKGYLMVYVPLLAWLIFALILATQSHDMSQRKRVKP